MDGLGGTGKLLNRTMDRAKKAKKIVADGLIRKLIEVFGRVF